MKTNLKSLLKRSVLAVLLPLLPTGIVRANNITVQNVKWASTGGGTQSDVTFDVSWDNSWRAEWIVPSADNVTGTDLTVANWDAAWVFVKFRVADQDGWGHATLSTNAADHTMPAGAAVSVGRSNDGLKGVGVFIHRNAAGQGGVNFQNVKLRWLHGDDIGTTKTVDLAVHAIEMVYVPEGAFMAGNVNGVIPASTTGSIRATANANSPFMINTDAQFDISFGTGPTTVTISNAYPSGYSAFYCMKYEITQGQYAAFLNALTRDQQATRCSAVTENRFMGVSDAHEVIQNRNTVKVESDPGGLEPRVYTTIRPYRACNYLSWVDGCVYAAWAGLRPMTELEFEKACRGPRYPVAGEYAWGGADIRADANLTVSGTEDGTEAAVTGGTSISFGAGWYGNKTVYIGAASQGSGPLRVGIFATTGSDRASAGASYWGIMELSGNLLERPVTIGHANGRSFLGTHGTGALTTPADWPGPTSSGHGWRGGSCSTAATTLRVADRLDALRTTDARGLNYGWRGVRTAP